MPITIVDPPVGGFIGPGVQVDVSTDFIGPIPSGSRWIFTLRPVGSEIPLGEEFFTSQLPRVTYKFWTSTGSRIQHSDQANVAEGAAVNLDVELVDQNGSAIDVAGQVQGKWSATAGELWKPQYFQQQEQGLTPAQAQQLQDVHDSTTPFVNLSQLLLPEFTNGPQGGTAAAALDFPVFGILVRITLVPPDLKPSTTPDPYWFPTLATVSVFRGSDLWMRVPIHTLSKIVGLLSENLTISATVVQQLEFSAGSGVQVAFRPGVEGQAFLMRFP